MIRQALDDAPHGQKAGAVKALAARLGVSNATIYRAARRSGTSRPRNGRDDYQTWVEAAVKLAHSSQPPVALDLAIRAGIAGGELPPQAADMPLGTAYRIARQAGLRLRSRRTQRMFADWPMQVIQFDASTSQHLIAVEPLGNEENSDGDWLLKLHRRPTPAGGYKNKPLPAHRQRVITYGIWDMCTGCVDIYYTVARGENAHDAIAALVFMLTRPRNERHYLRGVPDNLCSDQGPLFKSSASADLLSRLGIALLTGEPYRKERMGGIERQWRTLWARFERSLFLGGEDTITLSALRDRLRTYLAEENTRRRSRTPVGGRQVSRADAWGALMSRRPADQPLRELPPDALSTLYREAERVVDRSGIIRWEGEEYECSAWHNRRVRVRQALTGDDSLTLDDPATGERSTAIPLQRRAWGQVRGILASSLDRLLDDNTARGADPYAKVTQAAPANVTPLVARPAQALALDNPLDAGAYPDIHTAMADFLAQYPWPLSGDDRQAVADHLVAAGLRRETARELASSLLNAVTEDHL